MVCEVGATLRAYTAADHPVIEGFGPDEWSHSGRGQVLAPWPNRLADGRYEFNGVRAQAGLNEPERRNAMTPSMWRGLARIGEQIPDDVTFLQQSAENSSVVSWNLLHGKRDAHAPLAAHYDPEYRADQEKHRKTARESRSQLDNCKQTKVHDQGDPAAEPVRQTAEKKSSNRAQCQGCGKRKRHVLQILAKLSSDVGK